MAERLQPQLSRQDLDWQLDDPAGKGVEAARPIRDDIHTRVRALLDLLLSGVQPG